MNYFITYIFPNNYSVFLTVICFSSMIDDQEYWRLCHALLQLVIFARHVYVRGWSDKARIFCNSISENIMQCTHQTLFYPFTNTIHSSMGIIFSLFIVYDAVYRKTNFSAMSSSKRFWSACIHFAYANSGPKDRARLPILLRSRVQTFERHTPLGIT